MKHGHSFAIGILALALAACGGNGGGGSKSSVVGLTNSPRIEAVLSNTSLDPGYPYQDPLGIQTGDNITFQLVNYTGSGDNVTRNVLPVEAFRVNDPNAQSGTFSTSDGVFQAANTDTGTTKYIVTGRYGGQDYSAFYTINPRQIRLRGMVLEEGTGKPVYNATVDFYAPRNPLDSTSQIVVIATVHTGFDGTFRASIPAFNDQVATAADANAAPLVTFTVRANNLPAGYYPSFVYQGARFDAGASLCRVPLLSNETITDVDTGETALLPYKTGDRYQIVADDEDPSTNGTILLTPTSLYDTKPDADGCTSG